MRAGNGSGLFYSWRDLLGACDTIVQYSLVEWLRLRRVSRAASVPWTDESQRPVQRVRSHKHAHTQGWHNSIRSRYVRNWFSVFPIPPIPARSFPFPFPKFTHLKNHFHSRIAPDNSFPFPPIPIPASTFRFNCRLPKTKWAKQHLSAEASEFSLNT